MTAAAELRATAVAVRTVPRYALIAGIKDAKRIAADVGARMGGPLTGKKRRGLKLRAVDKGVEAFGTNGARATIQGVSPAGWVWVTTGTAGHNIRRRKRGPKRKMTVWHPGTSGRGGWFLVQQRVAESFPQIVDDAVLRALSRSLR